MIIWYRCTCLIGYWGSFQPDYCGTRVFHHEDDWTHSMWAFQPVGCWQLLLGDWLGIGHWMVSNCAEHHLFCKYIIIIAIIISFSFSVLENSFYFNSQILLCWIVFNSLSNPRGRGKWMNECVVLSCCRLKPQQQIRSSSCTSTHLLCLLWSSSLILKFAPLVLKFLMV